MQVQVLFFGVLKDVLGRSSDSVDLPASATLDDLLNHYGSRLEGYRSAIAMSVNQQYASLETELKAGDEIALLPPVSGGSPHAAVTRERIDTQAVLQRLKLAEDGAAVVFEGVVRNNTRGRRTLYLDYEAYEAMALKEMESLAAQALAQFKVREVALIHRLGRLEIGEISVLIVVASAHRGPAFDACRWLIDALKRTVPIWKKEYFEDGAVWADGEPFPAEVPTAQAAPTERPASK